MPNASLYPVPIIASVFSISLSRGAFRRERRDR